MSAWLMEPITVNIHWLIIAKFAVMLIIKLHIPVINAKLTNFWVWIKNNVWMNVR